MTALAVKSYADPLRKFAKRKETTIIPLYEANVIFANIDNLVSSAEAFCKDLMLVDLSGRVPGHGVGDICLKHVCSSRLVIIGLGRLIAWI